MNKTQYRAASRAIRSNGIGAIKTMRMREASVMLSLHFQKIDKLDEKAYVFHLARKYGRD